MMMEHVLCAYIIYLIFTVGPQLPPPGYAPPPEEETEESEKNEEEDDKKVGEWYEAMSEMEYPYYWNTRTGGWYGTHSAFPHTEACCLCSRQLCKVL